MNFTIQTYDPYDEAIQQFVQFNRDPDTSEHTENELITLATHAITRHESD